MGTDRSEESQSSRLEPGRWSRGSWSPPARMRGKVLTLGKPRRRKARSIDTHGILRDPERW